MPKKKTKKGKKKLRTKKAAKKRVVKITATGKTVIKQTNKIHNANRKTRKNLRHNKKPGQLAEGFARMVKKCFLHVSRKRKNKK